MNKNKTKLTKQITSSLKNERERQQLSQDDVAKKLGINVSTYKRIELGYNLYIEKDIRNALSEILNLNDNFWLQSASKAVSYRVPRELYDYLQVLKIDSAFKSDAEAISHCIMEHKKKCSFEEVQYELENMIETVLSNTYGKTMSSMLKQLKDYEYIRTYFKNELGINVEEILEVDKERKILEKRAKSY